MKPPALSVIIPVFNGEKFLTEAVATVRRSSRPVEIVVVDDGSTDETESIVRRLHADDIRYLRQENCGPAGARNSGLKLARADIIGFLDADDLWAGEHPDFALNYIESHEVDLVFGQTQCLTPSPADPEKFEPSGELFHSFQLGAAICRRALIEGIGVFDEKMRYGEDVDWFLRVRESGAAIATLPELSLYYRLHAGNQPQIYRNSRAGLLSAFHQSLERRRHGMQPAKGRPLVSVIIPVHNGEKFIAAAIESVLAQDYRPLELIVVDDGSTDGTAAIITKFPHATVHTQPQKGAGAARNAGVARAKGDLLGFLDADDLWTRGKLSKQVAVLMENPSLEAVFGHVSEFAEDDDGRALRDVPGPIPGTMLVRRDAFDRIGWFDETTNTLEGADWYLRALEKCLRTQMLPDVLYRRRIHGQNRSIASRDLNGYLRAIKASLDRRRLANHDADRQRA